jgi:hypothetical protein
MDRNAKPMDPDVLDGRTQLSLTISEGWLAALSGQVPEDGSD